MHTTTFLTTTLLALLPSALAQDTIYFGSATGYSGQNVDGICQGDVVGVAVAKDGTQGDCISAPANCLRGSTTAGAGVFSGNCWIDAWSQPGCDGDADSTIGISGEQTFGASDVQSFRVGCQMT